MIGQLMRHVHSPPRSSHQGMPSHKKNTVPGDNRHMPLQPPPEQCPVHQQLGAVYSQSRFGCMGACGQRGLWWPQLMLGGNTWGVRVRVPFWSY
jgi:hypothetical protein